MNMDGNRPNSSAVANDAEPRPQRRTIASSLPIYLTIGAVSLAAGIALGLHVGNKQALKLEKDYAHLAESNKSVRRHPVAQDTLVTKEMRRYALRRTALAFGLGTALCSAGGVVGVYIVSTYMHVNTLTEFSQRMAAWTKATTARFVTPFLSDLPSATAAFREQIANTNTGKWIRKYQDEAIQDANAEVQENKDEAAEINMLMTKLNVPVTAADIGIPPTPLPPADDAKR